MVDGNSWGNSDGTGHSPDVVPPPGIPRTVTSAAEVPTEAGPRTRVVSLSTIIAVAVAGILVVALGFTTSQLFEARDDRARIAADRDRIATDRDGIAAELARARVDLAGRDAVPADFTRAEQIAIDYAVGSSTIDFNDLDSWTLRLKANTTPQLGAKFESTGATVRAIMSQLQWNSTAALNAAKLTELSHGVYQVKVFLDVTSTTMQSPQETHTVAVYIVTVDRGAGWKVADVGGSAVGPGR